MKTVLITGGASGLGKNISMYLAEKSYNLVITYNTSNINAKNLKEELENKYDISVSIVKCNIKNDNEIDNLINYLDENNIEIDILINNAAICLDSLYEDKNREKFLETLNVNLVGTFMLSKKLGDLMYKRKSGVILNISSTNGIDKYYPMSLDYDASKAGLNSLTHNLALEYAPYVRVNSVAPGWVKTENEMKNLDNEYIRSEEEKIFLNRFAEMEEISKVIGFLISDDASYINNQIIAVDGGTYNG